MDKDTIKTAIREELGRRVAMSGGPEVFRRLVRGSSTLVESALRELVQEGVLKETVLRVGRIYHYPANSATRLEILTGFMRQMTEAPARASRPAHGAAREGAPARPVRDPAAARPEPAAAAPPSAPEGEKRPFVPQRAVKRGAGEAAVPRPDESRRDAAAVASDPEGEKKPFVPQKAKKRDTGDPRVAPRPTDETAPPASPAPAAAPAPGAAGGIEAGAAGAGEKKPFVPQKARKRDPNEPRPAPRPPASPAPGSTGAQPPSFAAAVTDPEAGTPAPEREPEGRMHAVETAELQAGPPEAPLKAELPPAAELRGPSGAAGAAHETPAQAGQPTGPPTAAELSRTSPPAPGQGGTPSSEQRRLLRGDPTRPEQTASPSQERDDE